MCGSLAGSSLALGLTFDILLLKDLLHLEGSGRGVGLGGSPAGLLSRDPRRSIYGDDSGAL